MQSIYVEPLSGAGVTDNRSVETRALIIYSVIVTHSGKATGRQSHSHTLHGKLAASRHDKSNFLLSFKTSH